MEKFIESFKHFKKIKFMGDYRLCWIPMKNGNGLWSVIELFDEELPKIDKNKVEICVY